MFDINSHIYSTLSPLNIPIDHLVSDGKSPAYIMFQSRVRNSNFADDKHDSKTYDVDLKYWYSSADGDLLAEEIERLMEEAGFIFDGSLDVINETKDKFGKGFDFIYTNYL